MRGWGYGMGKGRKLEEKMLILSSFYRKCFYRLRNQIGMKAMQVRAVIIASGEVQRVGYRDIVERMAHKMKLTGFVENIKPYDVRIVCEGDKAGIDSFVNLIRIKEYPIDVEHLDVRFEDATGEFEYFEIKRGDMTEELVERFDIARGVINAKT